VVKQLNGYCLVCGDYMVFRTWGLILFILLNTLPLYGLDRCVDYVPDVRKEHTRLFGFAFPWWYGVGQLRQESCCRNVSAFDGGIGIAQFMPKTSSYVQDMMKERLNPVNSKDAVRMQAFYMKQINSKENWTKNLWIAYQIYNGGRTTLYKEYLRVGVANHDKMREQCRRKVVKLKRGYLDMCDVNYDYSKRIYSYGQVYRIGVDGFSYW
jgi:hypothetical protein